ncbi:aspartate kinase [Pyrococcus horikoshii]|uniref:Aspartate kinase n=2 Tax=Pyrococcus horikoshii TaxID=53953 RepID=A0A832T160_PYRHR|nr:aspartate kinase [Pyrococcus horikoshii]HII61869.1 aspartate kinase [Pyrococcus horikoshii]
MIVIKFGGSSLRSEFKSAVSLIKALSEEKDVVVVVSALKGITDLLEKYTDTFDSRYAVEVSKTYLEFGKRMGIDTSSLSPYLKQLFNPPDLPPQALRDYILSIGELLSAAMIAEKANGAVIFPWDLFVAHGSFGNGFIDIKKSKRNVKLVKEALESGKIPIIPGFIANLNGYRVTLGRGGSDYSAVALGVLLNSELVAIMSDVEGIFTADPKMIPYSLLIPYMSYDEILIASKYGMEAIQWKAAKLAKEYEALILFGRASDWRMGTVVSNSSSHMPLLSYDQGKLLVMNMDSEIPYEVVEEGEFWRVYRVPKRDSIKIIKELHRKIIYQENAQLLGRVKA